MKVDVNDVLRHRGVDVVRARHDHAEIYKPNGRGRHKTNDYAHSANNSQGAIILDPRDPMRSARTLLASRFLAPNGERLLHRHRGEFWRFSGSCYVRADNETIRAEAWQFLEQARLQENGHPPFRPTGARVSDMLDAMQSVCHIDGRLEPPAWLDSSGAHPAAEYMPVANGLLHLPSGTLDKSTPRYFGIGAAEVAYDPKAPEPARWRAFLDELFVDDEEAISTLQDWFGYTLSPDTSQQKIMLIVGPTRSGKGTIARVLIALIGRDNVAAPTLAALQTNFGLAPLIGKSLAVISDARLGGRSDQAAIAERLLSISGEDALTIDRKFSPAWTGRLPTRFMLLTNELPRLSDTSGALAKRFIVLTLEQSFYGRENIMLTDSLIEELPGILNWAREGYRRLRQRGHFIQPASARETIEQLEILASPVTAFIRERCTIGPGLTAPTELLYQSWRTWCEANGRDKPGTAQTFGRDLKAAFPAIKTAQNRDGEDRYRVYQGVGLK